MFEKACGNDQCVCKGYPDPNTREALLRNRATLQQCVFECNKRKNCLGIEYWPKSDINKDGSNCFICPADPRKRNTVAAVRVSKSTRGGKAGRGIWANVYIKQDRRGLFGKFCK